LHDSKSNNTIVDEEIKTLKKHLNKVKENKEAEVGELKEQIFRFKNQFEEQATAQLQDLQAKDAEIDRLNALIHQLQHSHRE